MSKFPVLSSYRVLANVAALIIFVVGVVLSLETANQLGNQINLAVFVSAVLPFVLSSFGLAIVAEVILLALKIEEHLQSVSRTNQRIAQALIRGEKSAQTSIEAGPISKPTGKIKYSSAEIRSIPGARRGVIGTLQYGEVINIVGTNSDRRWVKIADDSEQWILLSEIEWDGDVNSLPVVSERS